MSDIHGARGLARRREGVWATARRPRTQSAGERLQRNALRPCEVAGCDLPRHGFGRYCRAHDRRAERTGDPEGQTIPHMAWRPYLVEARRFTSAQLLADHAGIVAALQWCAEQLYGPQTASTRRADAARPWSGYAVALGKAAKRGVEPDDLLCRVVAAYLARRLSPHWFRSDRHFDHQLARLFLRPAPPAGRTEEPLAADQEAPSSPRRVGVRVCEYTARRIKGAIGLLAMRAANEIATRLEARSPTADHTDAATASEPVEGARLPFN